MGTFYDDVDVLCPFFKRQESKKLLCEGLYENSSLVQQFETIKQKEFHKCNYCKTNYEKCELYMALNSKYE